MADILADWSAADLAFVKSGKASFGAVSRRIRHEYELWNPECSLTKRWHARPNERDIHKGVDFSIDHPDSVAERIENLLRGALQ